MASESASTRSGEPRERQLSTEVRARVGIPRPTHGPYRWSFALFFVALAAVPLALAGLWQLAVIAAVAGLVIWPGIRWYEDREALLREQIYKRGREAVGRVVAVEPGDRGHGHIVRVEFEVDKAPFAASVQGCPLARQGLMPGDDVIVVYDPAQPLRCLVLGRNRGHEGLQMIHGGKLRDER